MSNHSNCEVMLSEQRVKVGKFFINFIVSKLKYAESEKSLILLPGTLGTAQTDFKTQLENLPKLLQNYQVISWDPPGCGKSYPPERDSSPDNLVKNAEILLSFLDFLHIRKCSLLGYSAGGITSLFFASQHPERIEKLILTSTSPFLNEEQVNYFKSIRDSSNWSEGMRRTLTEVYGFEKLKQYWESHVDSLDGVAAKYTKEFMGEIMRRIKAETLIIYGEKDPFMARNLMDFMVKNIENSKLITFAEGKHNLHNYMADDFNKKVGEFLMMRSKF